MTDLEELRRRAEQLFPALDHLASYGVVTVDRSGRFEWFTKGAEKIIGLGITSESSEHWAARFGVFLPDGVTPFPEEQFPLVQGLKGVSTDGVEQCLRNAHHPDGIWIKVSGRPLRDASGAVVGAIAIFHDVSQERQQLARITLLSRIARAILGRHDLYSMYQAVLGHLEDELPVDVATLHTCDLGSRSLTVTARGPKSRPLGAAMGLPEGASSTVDAVDLGACLRGEQLHVPRSAGRPGLAGLHAATGIGSVVATPVVVDSTALGILVTGRRREDAFTADELAFLRTLSDHLAAALQQTRLLEDLRRSYDDMKRAQEQLVRQERLGALGQMASGVAHDFNNALGPILGFSELLLDAEGDLPPETRREYLRLINTATRDASKVVGRLKDFFRARREPDQLAPVDLNDVAREAVALTEPRWKGQADALGATIRVEQDLRATRRLLGDAAELRDLLANLILNAVDAMPEGGVLALRTDQDGEHVLLAVSDTGTGMTEEVQRRCLEPFFTTKGKSGTGLGLAMVHGTVRRHEGTIDIRSAVGAGTTFTLRFPALDADARAKAPSGTAPRPRSLRVLVVDDHPPMREMLVVNLTKDGHVVDAAANGREALKKFAPGVFDLVITDQAMPDMSGDQLAIAVKAASPRTPVLMLSGFGEFMNASGEKPQDVDVVLGKPVTREALRKAIGGLVAASGD